jgi:predicted regulator of Ras-like GTPase activity (Roadblock/LC7/MglB family)
LNYVYRNDLNWLVSDFAARVADVAHAIVVSADGVALALSEYIPNGFAGQLAAITSGLSSLMQGAARIFEAGLPTQALVEMEGGLMFVMAISDGSTLAVLASPDCDTELVSYEMTLLVEAVGDILTPAARATQGFLGGDRSPTAYRPVPLLNIRIFLAWPPVPGSAVSRLSSALRSTLPVGETGIDVTTRIRFGTM